MSVPLPALAYEAARRLFWILPASLRTRLHTLRHAVVRIARPRVAGRSAPRPGDLTWARFRSEILERRTSTAHLPIVFEATVDWGIALRQRPQHMALALGALGRLVIYRTVGDDLIGLREVAPGVWLANASELDDVAQVWRVVYSTSLYATAARFERDSRCGPVVYEYVDHLDASISGGTPALARLTALRDCALGGTADLVVSSATILHAEAVQRLGAHRCCLVPNGVDPEHYAAASTLTSPLPEGLGRVRGAFPIVVGYFGAIAPWLWYDAIADVARAMPDVGFVFIGPDYSGCVPRLPSSANVHYAGPVGYDELPAWARVFDVSWIPFAPGDVAAATSPLKLFEYLALGTPTVVTSAMSECVQVGDVDHGADAAGLVEALRRAAARVGDADLRVRLQARAAEHSWQVRAKAYVAALDGVAARVGDRLGDTGTLAAR